MIDDKDIITNSFSSVQDEIMDFIIDIVKGYFDCLDDYHILKSRKRSIVYPKQVAMFLIKKYTDNVTLDVIAKKFGNKNHASVIHAVNKIDGYIQFDKKEKKKIAEIEKVVNFKANAIKSNVNILKSYYYIDLDNFHSIKIKNNKSLLVVGFEKDELEKFITGINNVEEIKEHNKTGKYILEKRHKNGE
tara:strand:- start:376 stop:942 length:567 start_codon:yes stop_codon:yes gene_type:complete